MNCLNDDQIQSLADQRAGIDSNAGADARAHAASCARCQERVREREIVMQTIAQAMNASDLPDGARVRVERALAEASTPGATRLRDRRVERRPWAFAPRGATWAAGAVMAATLVAVMFVAPIVRGPATVSAAEILARSATQLTAGGSGVEVLEYELALDGIPREMMPDHADGVYRVRQVIDHDTSGRYLVATHGPDGRLLSSVAQDPAARRRVVALLIDGQPYRFEFDVDETVALSLPEMERLHMQASVAMIQASGDKSLQVVDTPAGRQYRIEVPHVSAQTPSAMWDLTEAEVLVDAGDYHIVQFAVKGSFLRQPYSVSYRLISRTLNARVSAEAFEVPRDPLALHIEGQGSAIPARDVLVASLREYARAKRDGR